MGLRPGRGGLHQRGSGPLAALRLVHHQAGDLGARRRLDPVGAADVNPADHPARALLFGHQDGVVAAPGESAQMGESFLGMGGIAELGREIGDHGGVVIMGGAQGHEDTIPDMAAKKRTLELESEIARLYALPLAEFTPERNTLATRLRKEGDREASERVKALAKPSASAWAVNVLFLDQKKKMDALLAAGERARGALQKALSHGSADALRDALQAERELRDDLRRQAVALLTEDGREPGKAIVDRITVNLEALALSPAAAGEAERGWLDRDLDPPGFEVLAGLQLAARPERHGLRLVPAEPPTLDAKRRQREGAAQEREKEEKAERERRDREDAKRQERIGHAEEKVARAAEEAKSLSGEAERLERAAAAAERAAEEARRRAEADREAAGRANTRAERAAEQLARAEAELAALR